MGSWTPDKEEIPRLSDEPMPPYRYVPGLGPHPLKHPLGHLRTRPSDPPAYPSAAAWHVSAVHRYAIDLFNHRYWWEAHEAWEGLWHQAPRESAEWAALRGLIQAAAALLKNHMGHANATDRLRRAALQHLHGALSHRSIRGGSCLGLDLFEFALRFDAFLTRPDVMKLPILDLLLPPQP